MSLDFLNRRNTLKAKAIQNAMAYNKNIDENYFYKFYNIHDIFAFCHPIDRPDYIRELEQIERDE